MRRPAGSLAIWCKRVAITDNGLGSGETAYYRIDDTSGATYVCSGTGDDTTCDQERLVNIRLAAYPNTDITQIKEEQFEKIYNTTLGLQYYMTTDLNGNVDFTQSGANSDNGIWAKISSANRIKNEIPAMIELQDKAFGFSSEDWDEWKGNNGAGVKIYGRSTTGNAYELSGENVASIQNFYPMKIDADDGAVIDFGNKARLKNTLIGAGVGGALGGFAAYQGAQLDVQNRWTTAMREYEDSLSTVFCRTGSRWLSRYNDGDSGIKNGAFAPFYFMQPYRHFVFDAFAESLTSASFARRRGKRPGWRFCFSTTRLFQPPDIFSPLPSWIRVQRSFPGRCAHSIWRVFFHPHPKQIHDLDLSS